MSIYAANPAGLPQVSPRTVERATKSLSAHNHGGELRPSYGEHSRSNRTATAVNFRSQSAAETFALARVWHCVSLPLLGHSFGAFPAPGGTRSSASHGAPLWGLGSSQNKLANHGQEGRANFFRAPPRKQTFSTWEPGPLAKLRPV
jgi:hypothetical protein